MILEHINDIAAICAGHGIQTAVISPGSRSAALTLAFARHPELETKVIPDERAAAFVALGIAQQQQKPVALICTSGSAALNYAPAIAEAYFQEIPLSWPAKGGPSGSWILKMTAHGLYRMHKSRLVILNKVSWAKPP